MAAGIVSTYFQLASHSKCMKNRITNIAFTQDTPIIKIHVGALSKGHQSCVVMKEHAVSAHKHTNTTPYFPNPP